MDFYIRATEILLDSWCQRSPERRDYKTITRALAFMRCARERHKLDYGWWQVTLTSHPSQPGAEKKPWEIRTRKKWRGG